MHHQRRRTDGDDRGMRNACGGDGQSDQRRAEQLALDFGNGVGHGLCRRICLKSEGQSESEAQRVNVFHEEDFVNVPLKGKEK